MLIITLLKGVPARTTRVVSVGGVLKREEMDIVMNPYDVKAIAAADYVKRRVGGKVVALTMGPDAKLVPIMRSLYHSEVKGVDECVVLSDRKMAGADTLATAYAVAMGIRKIVQVNSDAISSLMDTVKQQVTKEEFKTKAESLYTQNLIPNLVFSTLPSYKGSLVSGYVEGELSSEATYSKLQEVRDSIMKFLVLAGVKTSDGETGSVGPQVAEALSEIFGVNVPHVTYVHGFEVLPEEHLVNVERKFAGMKQSLQTSLPSLLTISPEYRPEIPPATSAKIVRSNDFRGKAYDAVKWDHVAIEADPNSIGLPGSPTFVGPGVDIGKPPVQKILGTTYVFKEKVESFTANGKTYGSFSVGDVVPSLPDDVFRGLIENGVLVKFSYPNLVSDLFRNGAPRTQ